MTSGQPPDAGMGEDGRIDLQPTLVGETISLRPLLPEDLEPLYAVAADPLIWVQHPEPTRHRREVFEDFFADALASRGALVVVDEGEVIGTSRYYEWNPQKREVAIGYTFLSRRYWGGPTNAEMKRLMLAHAFEFARRVWFHVGRQNLRSCRAMEKIGATLSHEAQRESRGVLQDYLYFFIEARR